MTVWSVKTQHPQPQPHLAEEGRMPGDLRADIQVLTKISEPLRGRTLRMRLANIRRDVPTTAPRATHRRTSPPTSTFAPTRVLSELKVFLHAADRETVGKM